MGKGLVRVQAEPMAARARGSWTEKSRMEAVWGKDRFEFKPSRWLLEPEGRGRRRGVKLVSPYKFPIFQAGPRVCLGKEMAFIQMKYVVASILSQFRIKPIAATASNDPVFVPLLTAHMAGGFKVLFQRREKEKEKEREFKTYKIPNLNNQKKSQFKRFQHRTDGQQC
ncbi:cytochrome P450 94B1-like [Cucurbita maxima]|uniref:Cytochrome P450 94B1-like n=1 Tax=Cucurbita maxima TaxID=3661 RepID=A0A6J1JG29_CUCMA|nr:cytochrome P450 94B1-like [Cucurbita maxima]